MTDMLEAHLRIALEVKALEADVPEDLAGRTIEALRELGPRRHVRWRYVAAAGIAAVGLVAAGIILFPSKPKLSQQTLGAASNDTLTGGSVSSGGTVVDAPAMGLGSKSGDAEAGPVAGVTGDSRAPVVASLNDLPKLVHNAKIKVRVDHFDRSWLQANDVASSDGGFVTTSKTSESDGGSGSGSLTIRVPSDRLDETLKDLRHLGTMTELTTSGEDVTAPMADLGARKKTALAEEAQLQNLLQNAGGVSDVLEIRSRLNDTRNEIESIEGQIASYQNRVDYATIDATVFSKGSTPGKAIVSGTLGRSIHTAGHVGMSLVAALIVVLGGLIPLAALIGLAWFVRRVVRRRSI